MAGNHQESSPIMAIRKAATKAASTKKTLPARPAAAKGAPAKSPTARASAVSPKAAKAVPGKTTASKVPTKPANTVTLKQLVAAVAEQQQIAKREADATLTGFVGMLVQHLKDGDRLRIGGLGILEVKRRPERAGRNPATGEAITIKASKKVAFRAAKELKEAV
jgi:DNA-binding protein HU-beta